MSDKMTQERLLQNPSGMSRNSSSQDFEVGYQDLGGIIDPYKRHEMSAQDSQVNLANWKLKQLGFVKGIVEKLRSSPTEGIEGTESDIRIRRNIFGSNARNPPKTTSMWDLIKECF